MWIINLWPSLCWMQESQKNVDIILNLNVKKNCPLEQFLYLPDEAEDKARERLVLTREGVNLTREKYEIQNNILKTAIIENGQSIHHALVGHGILLARLVLEKSTIKLAFSWFFALNVKTVFN